MSKVCVCMCVCMCVRACVCIHFPLVKCHVCSAPLKFEAQEPPREAKDGLACKCRAPGLCT